MTREFGLALGSGGARGIAHVHVIKALDDLGIRASIVSGSSIGSIVGAGYAAGMRGEEIEDVFRSTFSNRMQVLSKLWQVSSNPFAGWMKKDRGPLGQMDVSTLLDAFLPESVPASFEELELPLLVTATDFYGDRAIVFGSGELKPAVAASCAVPVLFKPVRIDGTVLVDGGFYNPVPFDIIRSDGRFVIGVDVVGTPEGKPGTWPSRMEAGIGASQLMMQAITHHKLANDPPEIFLRAPNNSFKVLDFLKVEEILENSEPLYEETKRKVHSLLETDKVI